jgi:hypothetical protein
VVGSVEHDEPKTAETARLALLPLVNFREAAAAAQRSAPAQGAEANVEPKKAEPS